MIFFFFSFAGAAFLSFYKEKHPFQKYVGTCISSLGRVIVASPTFVHGLE